MNQVNKTYLPIAKQVCKRIRQANIPCGIKWISLKESIYIKLGTNNSDIYSGLRISNHNGKLLQRYNLRFDINQSYKEIIKGREYFFYCNNDLNGLIMKIIKEVK
jgi:hypothetical protein